MGSQDEGARMTRGQALIAPKKLVMGFALLVISLVALAAAGTYADFLKAVAQRESSMNPNAHNPYGYVGLFQMGEAALIDAGYYKSDGSGKNDWTGAWTGKNGVTSLAAFKNDPQAQITAITDYHQKVWGYVKGMGLDQYVGQTVGGVLITESGLIAGSHLVGAGNMAKFLRSGGSIIPRDGNNTPITEYVAKFGGYQVSGSAPSLAAVSGGTIAPGLDVSVITAQPPGAGPSASPGMRALLQDIPTDLMSPAEAYYQNTGHSQGEVDRMIKMSLGGLLMAWISWVVVANWRMYSAGGFTTWRLVHESRRALTLLAFACVAFFW